MNVTLCASRVDIATIHARTDAVEELLENEKTFFDLLAALSQMLDLDHIVRVPHWHEGEIGGSHIGSYSSLTGCRCPRTPPCAPPSSPSATLCVLAHR